ncbi:expressed unknown protein [Seminavis robusta]|uniref:Uncharacterized protein n=1 Tax=Seminavis robusta TaxID=568900 RepID=A0A9N8EFE9_9STRA|nr:expressed unknown protein [Seminavis robusta]|eukprot:Sro865_g212870.1 n/a (532) ;mRNA; r:28803-30398
MAGTRLTIQLIFVVEFFLLALAALYFGLYRTKDPISHNLPIYQRGRALIQESLRVLEETDLSALPILPLAIATSEQYKSSFAQQQQQSVPHVSFQIKTPEEINEVCQQQQTVVTNSHSVWLCPPSSSNDANKITIKEGVTLLYPNTDNPEQIQSLTENLLKTLPSSSPARKRQRKPLKVTLMLEHHRKEWQDWADALASWIHNNQQTLLAWPCVQQQNGIDTQVILSTLQENQASQSKDNNNSGPRLVSTLDVQDSIVDRQTSNSWNVILYIPKKTPLHFVQDDTTTTASPAMYADSTLVTTIGQPETLTVEQTQTITTTEQDGNETITKTREETTHEQLPVSIDKLVEDAMAPLGEFLLQQCMGATTTINNADDDDVQVESDGSLPQWQSETWLQQTVATVYQQVKREIRDEADWLLQSSTWVVIDDAVAAQWQTLVQAMQEVARHVESASDNKQTSQQHWLQALTILEDALDHLQVLRTDPTLMEPLRFSAPQFLAIFAPLCLPLFFPHLIGLIREWKRYKLLHSKKTE